MKQDFSKIRYLMFSADDPYEASFKNVIIDLEDDTVVDGIIQIGEVGDRTTINVKRELRSLHQPEFSIFAKVVDSGVYYLLDDAMNIVFEHKGYVPKVMDYYNINRGFGDYIDIKIDDPNTGKLVHAEEHKIKFNDIKEWNEYNVDERTGHKLSNDYTRGLHDAYDVVERIIENSNDSDSAVAAILTIINDYNKNISIY